MATTDGGASIRADVLGKLESYYADTAAAVADAETDYFTPENAINGWKGSLKTAAWLLARLRPDGDLGRGALESADGHTWWIAQAKNDAALLSDIQASMGKGRFAWARFWDEVVVQTGTDVADLGKKTAAALPSTLDLQVLAGIVVVGLIAVVVLRVT